MVYEARGYPADRYDRAGEAKLMVADVGRMWRWVGEYLAEPGRKVVVYRHERSGMHLGRPYGPMRRRKIWQGVSGDPVPTLK